jgi:hypothetical protein
MTTYNFLKQLFKKKLRQKQEQVETKKHKKF